MEVGTLSINSAHFPSKETSWGGYKQSGYGREGGKDGFLEYLQKKTIHINLNV
jgi:aldehyde dehydrogenase (NAD+)